MKEKSASNLPAFKPDTKLGKFWVAPALLAVMSLGTSGFLLTPHPAATPSGIAAAAPKNFGYMQQTEKWIGQTLSWGATDLNLDAGIRIAEWKGSAKLYYPGQKNFLPASKSSLSNDVVFPQLGVHNPWQAFPEGEAIWGFALAGSRIYNDLSAAFSPLNRPAQNAALKIENGRAIDFHPDLAGQSADLVRAQAAIEEALFRRVTHVSIPIIQTEPNVTLAGTNELGIRELVAHGESDFSGSSQNRIQNIKIGAQRFNGLILKPGEEFSFNQNLGEVTAAAGFKPEIVIKSNGTVPELGGGLCQVSTTAFRAALYGGLAITARRNHSFAVSYYAPQGTDATIYPGAVDFKFINDTPAYLLIATRIEGKKLIFDYYGTSDGRQVAVDGPHTYGFGPGGAMKARLTRTVTLDGKTTAQDFYSNYVSRNLFPKIEEYPKPAAPTPMAAEPAPAAAPPANPVPAPSN